MNATEEKPGRGLSGFGSHRSHIMNRVSVPILEK